ncbi:phytanoyl-CoA dioxygenase family protein, partial [bacterium]|nr:phytanoyl-CoA dioxygenase family protein [bacterium]
MLTKEMRRDWVENGYIHLKGALTRDQAASYLAAADEVIKRYRDERPNVRDKAAFTIIQTV